MNWESASFALTAIVLIMQGISLYTQSQIKNWTLEKFLLKSDFMDLLELWNRPDGSRPK